MAQNQAEYSTKAQTIFRVSKNTDNPFVMIDRRVIENPKLSWKAKGLLAYLLSRPDNWTVRFRDLVKRSPDGAHTVRVSMKELVLAGHVKVTAERENGRVKQWTYTVHEKPLSPDAEFQQVETPQVENRTFNNTDSFSKNDSNGADAPTDETTADFPVDWKIGHGQEVKQQTERQHFEAQAKDRANLVNFQCAGAGDLAYAFMVTRNILLSDAKGKISGYRKAAREMLEMKVKPEHVTAATKQLMEARDKRGNPLTVVDLFSIRDTAISLAHSAEAIRETVVVRRDENGTPISY